MLKVMVVNKRSFMRLLINHFVKMISENLNVPEPIYEFGAFQVPGQEHMADLRKYFPAKNYVGTDMRYRIC